MVIPNIINRRNLIGTTTVITVLAGLRFLGGGSERFLPARLKVKKTVYANAFWNDYAFIWQLSDQTLDAIRRKGTVFFKDPFVPRHKSAERFLDKVRWHKTPLQTAHPIGYDAAFLDPWRFPSLSDEGKALRARIREAVQKPGHYFATEPSGQAFFALDMDSGGLIFARGGD